MARLTVNQITASTGGCSALSGLSAPGDPLISLVDAQRLLPRRGDRPAALATIRRWMARGVRVKGGGAVKLQHRRIGGLYYTKPSWIEAFVQVQNPPALEAPGATPLEIHSTDSRKAARIKSILASRGLLGAEQKRAVLGVQSKSRKTRPV